MSNYSSLFNQSFVDVDSLTTNTIISDSLILTAELDQLQLGQTLISDTNTTSRVGTIPPGVGNFEFVTTASGNPQTIAGDNTWTGVNTFTSISGLYAEKITVSGYDVADTFNEHEHALSTGIYDGGILSAGNTSTNFSISNGAGIIVQNVSNPHVVTPISWTGLTNIAVTNILTQLLTFVSINSSGTVIQSATRPTNAECRSQIYLGVVVHTDKTSVTGFNQQQQFINAPSLQLRDFLEALGPIINIDGNAVSGNSNLTFTKSSGVILAYGANYYNSPLDPHKLSLAAYNSVVTALEYRLVDGTNYFTGAVPGLIDPNYYESAGVRTVVPVNKFTVQRVYTFTSNNVKLQYGQTIYNSLAAAKDNFRLDAFTTEASIKANGVLIAYIIVKQGTTSLTNASDCFIINAGKFEGSSSSAGGTTLQLSYDNSATPEILTDSTRGALSLKVGSGSNSDNVLEVLNLSGNTTFSVAGGGSIVTNLASGVLHSVSGNITSSLIVDADISGQLSYNKLNLTTSVTNGDLFGGIMYGKLYLSGMVNNNDIHPTAGISYSKLTLTNSIIDGDIESSAAINYSKLSLSGKITNNDIVASAGIPYSKLNLAASVRASDINSISGSNGQVLTASGGVASWTTATATNATNSLNIDINTYIPIATTSGTPNRLPFYTNSGDGYNALKSSDLLYYVEKLGTLSPVTPDIFRLYAPSINCSGDFINNGSVIVTNGNVTLSNGSIQLNGNIETTAGTFFGPLSGTATAATSSTTAALNTNTTAIATTAFVQRALENFLTIPIHLARTGGFLNSTNTTSEATRIFTNPSEHPRAMTTTLAAPYIMWLNSSDYPTIGTYTPKLRLTTVFNTNGTSLSGVNISPAFRSISASGSISSGIAYNLGSGILFTMLSGPAANRNGVLLTATSSGMPTLSGQYAFSVYNSAAFHTNTNCSISVSLDVIYS